VSTGRVYVISIKTSCELMSFAPESVSFLLLFNRLIHESAGIGDASVFKGI